MHRTQIQLSFRNKKGRLTVSLGSRGRSNGLYQKDRVSEWNWLFGFGMVIRPQTRQVSRSVPPGTEESVTPGDEVLRVFFSSIPDKTVPPRLGDVEDDIKTLSYCYRNLYDCHVVFSR